MTHMLERKDKMGNRTQIATGLKEKRNNSGADFYTTTYSQEKYAYVLKELSNPGNCVCQVGDTKCIK